MNNIEQFFIKVLGIFQGILSEDILPGLSLFTLFFYTLLAACFFTVFTRR